MEKDGGIEEIARQLGDVGKVKIVRGKCAACASGGIGEGGEPTEEQMSTRRDRRKRVVHLLQTLLFLLSFPSPLSSHQPIAINAVLLEAGRILREANIWRAEPSAHILGSPRGGIFTPDSPTLTAAGHEMERERETSFSMEEG